MKKSRFPRVLKEIGKYTNLAQQRRLPHKQNWFRGWQRVTERESIVSSKDLRNSMRRLSHLIRIYRSMLICPLTKMQRSKTVSLQQNEQSRKLLRKVYRSRENRSVNYSGDCVAGKSYIRPHFHALLWKSVVSQAARMENDRPTYTENPRYFTRRVYAYAV